MNEKYCPHCWPTKRKSHLNLHIEYYGTVFLNFFALPFSGNKKLKTYRHRFWGIILEFLSYLKLVGFDSKPNENKLYNRGLIFFREAQKRGLNIQAVSMLGKYTQEFRLVYQNKVYHYEGVPFHITPVNHLLDDKYQVKKILEKNGFPVPKGSIFGNLKKALSFFQNVGFPLVVKPAHGSLSHHATYPIKNSSQLTRAIKIAQIYKPKFMVEKYIRGNVYRATVIGKKHVFVCQKERANIVGNSTSTIGELIKQKNANKHRGTTHQMNTTLHEIPLDETLENNLNAAKLNLESILTKNKKVYLQDKFILSAGCDIINCTQRTHPDNKKLFLRVAKIFDTDLVGIDFIAPDISKSYKKQVTAMIETNSLPYLDMHQYPSQGKSEPVAKIGWNIVLDKIKSKQYI